ncbi:uncharacterized protein LTR77_011157 [Saxophila tyrrhenica]|uniref:Uncharacterized protein n=1 Tax=Saxophila tyrrhenica TaxID=1690608 RepID=A0AAV9NTM2_9PEZI|nr:hypothetical protein LTR77_011157 [Saxophila tyrrhenica]
MDPFDHILQGVSPYPILLASITNGDIPSVRRELEQLAQQSPEIDLTPALLHCVHKRQEEAMTTLLESSATPEESVVEAAVGTGEVTMIKPLLIHGWPIDHTLRSGIMPSLLGYAVNNEELLTWLLARGADPNALSTIAETPSSVAVRDGAKRSIQMLFDAGGDANIGNLLHCAVERRAGQDTAEIIELLISRGAPVDGFEFEQPSAQQLRWGFSRGTALHKACYLGNSEATSALLEHGADPYCNRRYYDEEEQCTPLDVARANGNEAIMAMLQRNLARSQMAAKM